MIYATGGIHGNFKRFQSENFPDQERITGGLCNHLQGLWRRIGQQKKATHKLDWLLNLPFTTLFVSGNHENFNFFSNSPVEE